MKILNLLLKMYNKNKQIFNLFVYPIIGVNIVVYLIMSYIAMELNVSNWTIFYRINHILFSIMASLIPCLVSFTILDNKD